MIPNSVKRRRSTRARRAIAIRQSQPWCVPTAIPKWESELLFAAFVEVLGHKREPFPVEEFRHGEI